MTTGKQMLGASTDDLVQAYRRAKVDIYRRDEPRALDLLEYEESLADSLEHLRLRINSAETEWVGQPEFAGSFTLAQKKARHSPHSARSLIWSDAAKRWTERPNLFDEGQPTAEFRL